MKATGIVRRIDDLGRVVSNNSRRTGTAIATAEDIFIPAVGMVIAFCRASGRTVPQELLED